MMQTQTYKDELMNFETIKNVSTFFYIIQDINITEDFPKKKLLSKGKKIKKLADYVRTLNLFNDNIDKFVDAVNRIDNYGESNDERLEFAWNYIVNTLLDENEVTDFPTYCIFSLLSIPVIDYFIQTHKFNFNEKQN